MPGSALEFRCHSHSLFGLLRATAAKDTTVVAEPEVRIRVQVADNQTRKRRSELRVRNPTRWLEPKGSRHRFAH